MNALNPSLPVQKRTPAIPSAVIAMLLFVATEVMLFMGFISAFSIFKAGSLLWPPADQPRLPVAITSINTGILLFSGALLILSNIAFRRQQIQKAAKLFAISTLCGMVFLGIQGSEWFNLIRFGLTFKSSAYGSYFYLIIGAHALHAIIAIGAMIALLPKFKKGTVSSGAFYATQTFWYFVVGIWPVLFGIVYF